jgi:hypothetical protein
MVADMTDDEREAQIRQDHADRSKHHCWAACERRFWLRRLDEAREQLAHMKAEYQDEDGISELRAELRDCYSTIDNMEKELTRLRASPGTDAMKCAERLWNEIEAVIDNDRADRFAPNMIAHAIIRAELASRAQAIEEAARIVDHRCWPVIADVQEAMYQAERSIRALAATAAQSGTAEPPALAPSRKPTS